MSPSNTVLLWIGSFTLATAGTAGAAPSAPPPGAPKSVTQVVRDGSFEAGSPNPFWSQWSSDGSYAIVTSAQPHSGSWVVTFRTSYYSEGYRVDQSVSLPAGASAILTFYAKKNYWMTNSQMTVVVDSTTVFTGSDSNLAESWTQYQVNLSSFADGGSHVLSLRGVAADFDFDGISVDDVSLEAPDPSCATPNDDDPEGCGNTLVEPASGTVTSTTPLFTWQCVNDAVSYEVRLQLAGIGAWQVACSTSGTSCSPTTPLEPGHVYSAQVATWGFSGTTLVCLSEISTFTVGGGTPVADFTWTPTVPAVDQLVSFHDQSTNQPTTWLWEFGDGPGRSTLQNPTHRYAATGTYTVNLTVGNESGGDSVEKQITVAGPPTASFTWTPEAPMVGDQVTFTDTSSGAPTSWQWTFGDGDVSSNQDPVHTYAGAGTFTVALTAANDYGSGTASAQIRVTESGSIVAGPEVQVSPPGGDVGSVVHSAADRFGNRVLVWSQSGAKSGTGASGDGVFGRYLTAEGNLGEVFPVDPESGTAVRKPSVSFDAAGNFVVGWEKSGGGVFGHLFDSGQASLGGSFRLDDGTATTPEAPQVAATGSGMFLATWRQAIGKQGEGIFGRLFNPDGSAEDPPVRVDNGGGAEVSTPSAATSPAGNYLVVWHQLAPSKTLQDGYGIFGRGFDPGGQPTGGPVEVNTNPAGEPVQPAVSSDAAGNGIVVWTQNCDDGGGLDIWGRRVAPGGMPVGTQFKVNSGTVGSQTYPTVAANAVGDFVVAWESGPATNKSIFGRFFTADGVPLGPDFEVATSEAGVVPRFPKASVDSGDQVVICYTKEASDGSRTLVYRPFAVSTAPGSCAQDDATLCLNAARFQVRVWWRNYNDNSTGVGHAVPITGDTGYFWFFDSANVELVVKVLDGTWLNGNYWVFYGALSDVEYTITVSDTENGSTATYFNPAHNLASAADTEALTGAKVASPTHTHKVMEGRDLGLGQLPTATGWGKLGSPPVEVAACSPTSTALCLAANRFRVEVAWRSYNDGSTGQGQAVTLTGDTGYFWFFSATNVELILKVLDGTSINDAFWVFYGALSDVEYTITVTDTQTGQVRTYANPAHVLASEADTNAFIVP